MPRCGGIRPGLRRGIDGRPRNLQFPVCHEQTVSSRATNRKLSGLLEPYQIAVRSCSGESTPTETGSASSIFFNVLDGHTDDLV